ncbi:NACHT, LRR and PYD domains-containing protein 12-like [Trichosurus vulpecula]|uniref:NACHT, LRR and PYD domains-containing protein 12-like n=1 Tax=Trichosurus vulpecula TaxID=9337 RepID=UPI00186B580B|nr:NACHT, LRR and PYD domains-containing protein 12-like [Trichosurus vulpecula]
MSETVRCRLVPHLEHLTAEELEKFKLYLVDYRYLPRGRLEEADLTKVADLLVSSLGEQKAWEVALSMWEKMGLRELCERARKEDVGSVPALPVLPPSSDERNKYQERMRKKFQLMRDRNSRPGEQELFQHRFTQLLLLGEYRYKEQKQRELLVRGLEHALVMEKQGRLIEVSALFDPDQNTGTQPHTVVLQGASGIGKTTLAIKVMLDWAEGKLYQNKFDYVFYLICRELNQLGEREMSFADLIANDWPGPQAPMAKIMSQPERLLFIIDGLDELKFPCNEHRYDLCKDWKQPRPVPILLSSLLRKTMLPEASLLLTTRLTALGKFSPLLENPRHVEILGFSLKHRKEYFCKFFRNEDLGEKAFSLLKGNDTLLTMCSVPLMNWIVCTCLKQQRERGQDPIRALKSTTALYMCYLSNLITPDDKDFILQHLRGLCELAAEGIWGKKLLFEGEDLRRHNVEAADVSAFLDMNIFQKDSGCENCYSFIHLSFQEFFAAMFYLMSRDEVGVKSPDSSIPNVKKLLEECSQHDDGFVVLVVHFLFGFLNAETAKELENNFRCRISPEVKLQLLQWVEGETKRDFEYTWFFSSEVPKVCSYLYETQDAEFVKQALANIQDIRVGIEHCYDAVRAAFCIKQCPRPQRLSILFLCTLPAGVWQDLSSVVHKNQNLKELELSCIRFADSCMEDFFEGLRNPNCKLEKLSLSSCNLPPACWHNLFSALSSNKSLKDLDLRLNSFEEGAMKCLGKALENQNCKLEKLSLECCHLTHTCLQKLCSALNSNETLKDLDLSQNSFEEGAMKLLCKALENQNCKLEKLRLACCCLTQTCLQNLFSALNRSESLKDLDLSENSFQEGTMKFLCKALENQNCKLEKLSFARCYLTQTCLQNLLSALSSSESLKDLDLSEISFEEGAVKLLCKALENQNCKLEKLRLHYCEFMRDSFLDLLNVICSSENLKNSDLRYNYSGDEGMKVLPVVLEKQNHKLQTLILPQHGFLLDSKRSSFILISI